MRKWGKFRKNLFSFVAIVGCSAPAWTHRLFPEKEPAAIVQNAPLGLQSLSGSALALNP
jgi:hypothetical protein